MLDWIGAILWITVFASPLITVPLAWKFCPAKKIVRVIMGLVLAAVVSFFSYHISLEIIFRHGMGPDSVY